MPLFFLILGLLSFACFFIGEPFRIYYMATGGMFIGSLSILLFSLTSNKHSKNIKKEFRGRPVTILSGILILICLFFLYHSINLIRDIPYYQAGNYKTLDGVPTKISNGSTGRQDSGDIDVTIKGKTITLPEPRQKIKDLKGDRFIIKYLPHSEWIIGYKIIPNK